MSYSIYDPVKDFTLKISDTPLADDAIQVDVGAYNRVLKLRTSPKDGWMQQTVELQDIGTVDVARPDWEVPLIIGGVVLGIVLAAALAAMLIEKECHQTLLRSMLPVKTLPYVERGLNFCEQFQTVTILFSDIVSYTNMAAQMDPMAVVNMLNELYFMYDRLVEKHNVYKVETIGDAFMCAGGVPDATSAVHGAEAVANMALDMIESTRTFVTSTGLSLQIRVGMHSGPVVGAVIGLKMPHYCLFGDTVNTASRMESNSEAMRTHLSASSFNLLQSSQSDYNLSARGEMDIKGKGKMFTYWLDAPKNQKGDATIVAVTDVNLQ
jgi:class 3 adenylate cyclase